MGDLQPHAKVAAICRRNDISFILIDSWVESVTENLGASIRSRSVYLEISLRDQNVRLRKRVTELTIVNGVLKE